MKHTCLALAIVGIENALRIYQGLLRPGGYFAFTEAVWRTENPPREVKASFEDYPRMGWVPGVLAKIEKSDFALVGHFTLPDETWWGQQMTASSIRPGRSDPGS